MNIFVIANNVQTTLSSATSSTGTTFTLSSSANLPTLLAGQMMPITFTDAATRLTKEICYVTNISGTTLTVIRAREGTGAQNWSVGDGAACLPTAGTVALLQNVQAGTYNSSIDSGAVNAYSAALTPAILAYVPGAELWVNSVLNGNTGVSTLSVNGLASMPIHGVASADLQGGEIVAGYAFKVRVNSAATAFDLIETTGGSLSRGDLQAADIVSDYIVSGINPTVPSPASLSMTIPAGAAYILGQRTVLQSAAANTYPVSSDTYVSMTNTGVVAYASVANGAAAPAAPTSAINLLKVVTSPIVSPVPTITAGSSGGTLAAGTYQGAVVAYDATGYGVVSSSFSVTVVANGTMIFNWVNPLNETAMDIYATIAGSTTLGLVASGVTGTTYTYTGSVAPGAAAPTVATSNAVQVTDYITGRNPGGAYADPYYYGADPKGIVDSTSAIISAIMFSVYKGIPFAMKVAGTYVTTGVLVNFLAPVYGLSMDISDSVTLLNTSVATANSPTLAIYGIGGSFRFRGGTYNYQNPATSRQGSHCLDFRSGAFGSTGLSSVDISDVDIDFSPNFGIYVQGNNSSSSNTDCHINNIRPNKTLGDGVHVGYFNEDVRILNVSGGTNGDDVAAIINDTSFSGVTSDFSIENISSANFSSSVVHVIGGANGTIKNISGTAASSGETLMVSLIGNSSFYSSPNTNIGISGVHGSGPLTAIQAGNYSSIDGLTADDIVVSDIVTNGVVVSTVGSATVGSVTIGDKIILKGAPSSSYGILIGNAKNCNIGGGILDGFAAPLRLTNVANLNCGVFTIYNGSNTNSTGNPAVYIGGCTNIYLSEPCFYVTSSAYAYQEFYSFNGDNVKMGSNLYQSSLLSVSSTTTSGAITATAAQLAGQYLADGATQTAAFTVTTDTAVNILSAMTNAVVGTAFKWRFINNDQSSTGYAGTLAGGTGVTVGTILPNPAVPKGGYGDYVFTFTAIGSTPTLTVDCVGGNASGLL
jgi:hypothetical protein